MAFEYDPLSYVIFIYCIKHPHIPSLGQESFYCGKNITLFFGHPVKTDYLTVSNFMNRISMHAKRRDL